MAATRQPAAVRVSDTGTSRTVVVDPRVVEMCSVVWASNRTPDAVEFSTVKPETRAEATNRSAVSSGPGAACGEARNRAASAGVASLARSRLPGGSRYENASKPPMKRVATDSAAWRFSGRPAETLGLPTKRSKPATVSTARPASTLVTPAAPGCVDRRSGSPLEQGLSDRPPYRPRGVDLEPYGHVADCSDQRDSSASPPQTAAEDLIDGANPYLLETVDVLKPSVERDDGDFDHGTRVAAGERDRCLLDRLMRKTGHLLDDALEVTAQCGAASRWRAPPGIPGVQVPNFLAVPSESITV